MAATSGAIAAAKGMSSGPKGFQTETWVRLGGATGLYQAIEGSLSMGANVLELPGGYSAADPTTLADDDQALEGTACCAN